MSNYKYQISGIGIIIVSKEEHLKIQEGAQQGVNMIYLREGTMGVNPIKIGFFEETNLPTKIQEQEKDKTLKIDSQKEFIITDNQRNTVLDKIKTIREKWSNNTERKNDFSISNMTDEQFKEFNKIKKSGYGAYM